MRIFRSILITLIAASVALLPVSAATAMAHATMADMSMSAPDGECASCKAIASDLCSLKCCGVQMLSVEGLVLAEPMPERFVRQDTARVAAVSPRPDPPPPRV